MNPTLPSPDEVLEHWRRELQRHRQAGMMVADGAHRDEVMPMSSADVLALVLEVQRRRRSEAAMKSELGAALLEAAHVELDRRLEALERREWLSQGKDPTAYPLEPLPEPVRVLRLTTTMDAAPSSRPALYALRRDGDLRHIAPHSRVQIADIVDWAATAPLSSLVDGWYRAVDEEDEPLDLPPARTNVIAVRARHTVPAVMTVGRDPVVWVVDNGVQYWRPVPQIPETR